MSTTPAPISLPISGDALSALTLSLSWAVADSFADYRDAEFRRAAARRAYRIQSVITRLAHGDHSTTALDEVRDLLAMHADDCARLDAEMAARPQLVEG